MNALGHLKGLRVTGRTSSFAFKSRAADVAEVGEKLKVSNVLTGSVRKAGDRLRITAQLVSVADGFQLWSERRYDRQADDVFTIQDEIARRHDRREARRRAQPAHEGGLLVRIFLGLHPDGD